MKKLFWTGGILAGTALAVVTFAQQNSAPRNFDVTTLHVQGNVYMLQGAGGNIAVQIGDEGVLVVDTGVAAASDKVIAAIHKLSDKPLQYIMNTDGFPDHVGGNDAVRRVGTTITGANVAGNLTDATQGAAILAHENLLNRMSAPTGKKPEFEFGWWPTETYVDGQKEVFFNEEPVIARWQPAANTDGDSLVIFRRSDVVATGEIFNTVSFPYIDLERGGSIQGEINALNNILDIAIPKHEEEGGTYIIPGHGRICDEYDVLEYRDMVTIIRDRIQDAIKRGLTLDQVKTANLTLDYDARWGAKTGVGTSANFVESVYKSLTAKK